MTIFKEPRYEKERPKPTPKPKPPPNRLQCGFCGFTAPKPEFKHICWSGIALSISLVLLPICLLTWLGVKIFHSF
jgi:hypothetical protein